MKMNRLFGVFLLSLSLPVFAAELEFQQQPAVGDETSDAESPTEEDTEHGESQDSAEALELGAITVTGTLLREVNPASQVLTLTVEDFEQRGVHSAEDIVRSLPQNKASLNSSSSLTDTILSAGRDGGFPDLQGNAAANLRGLGLQNTLVLVNGRRTAGSPIFEGNFVNLSNIPFAAIERVEVLLDGASSIYGADAVGGVINFILRERWSGSETSVRYEASNNGGDLYSLNQVFGTTWLSGNAVLAISTRRGNPVSSRKAGWTTTDLSARGGTDFRSEIFGSPGVVRFFGSLPGTYDGTEDWNRADFSTDNVDPLAGIDDHLTSETRNNSLSLIVSQGLTDWSTAFMDLQYAKNYTDSSRGFLRRSITVETGHPLNRYGRSRSLGYAFVRETESGLIPSAINETNQERIGLTGGIEFSLAGDWRLELSGTHSESESETGRVALTANSEDQVLEFEEFIRGVELMPNPAYDPTSPGAILGFTPRFVPVLDNDGNQIPLPADQAINPFGNGSAQSARLAEFVRLTTGGSPVSTTRSFKAVADGVAISIPGGDIRMAIGAEYQAERIDYTDDERRVISSPSVLDTAGEIVEPKRDILSAFVDASVPIIGSANEMPGVQSLELQLSARWDNYDVTANRLTPAAEGNLDSASFRNLSPKIGLAWRPVSDLRVRATWTEAFRAPNYSEILQPQFIQPGSGFVIDQFIGDPLVMVEPYFARFTCFTVGGCSVDGVRFPEGAGFCCGQIEVSGFRAHKVSDREFTVKGVARSP